MILSCILIIDQGCFWYIWQLWTIILLGYKEHIFVIFMLTLSLLDEETVERNNRPQYKSKAWYYNCSCLWSGMKNLTWNPEFFGEGYNCYCEKCSPPCWNLWLSFYWPIVYILHALKYWNLGVYMESYTCLFASTPDLETLSTPDLGTLRGRKILIILISLLLPTTSSTTRVFSKVYRTILHHLKIR